MMKAKDQLPGFVLADLYSKSLVFIDNEVNAVKEVRKSTQNVYLGSYEGKVIVLVNDSENMYAGDENIQFLSGILNACKISVASIALINVNKHPVNFMQLKKDMKPEFLLLFGIDALQIELPFAMPLYQVQLYDKCQIATAPSLSDLNQSTPQAKTEKTKLWKSLQKMFNLEK